MTDTLLPLAPEATPATKLGRYDVVCRLSTGGMSQIFLAYQRGVAGFRKLVVLKQILPDIKSDENFVRMFLNEAKLAAAFSHPNIAQVFDLDVDGQALFLAMEFVPGATLVEVARACRESGQRIPVGFTLAAVRDTALALHYAHTYVSPLGEKSTVIHRDVAEKNIMVTYDGATKLLDFGVAKSVQSSMTAVGVLKGSAGYMSPEQLRGETLDARSDVFSLGIVLHELLTGVRLFHADKLEDELVAPMRMQPPPPSRKNPEVTPALDLLAFRALEKDRERRIQTAFEFARAIEDVSGNLIWRPDQMSEFMQSLFAQRREQTQRLFSASQFQEGTGELNLQGIFPGSGSHGDTPVPGFEVEHPGDSGEAGVRDEPRTPQLLGRSPAEHTMRTPDLAGSGSLGDFSPEGTARMRAPDSDGGAGAKDLPYARRETRASSPAYSGETSHPDSGESIALAKRDFAQTAVIQAGNRDALLMTPSGERDSTSYEILEHLGDEGDDITSAADADMLAATHVGHIDPEELAAAQEAHDSGAHAPTEIHPLRSLTGTPAAGEGQGRAPDGSLREARPSRSRLRVPAQLRGENARMDAPRVSRQDAIETMESPMSPRRAAAGKAKKSWVGTTVSLSLFALAVVIGLVFAPTLSRWSTNARMFLHEKLGTSAPVATTMPDPAEPSPSEASRLPPSRVELPGRPELPPDPDKGADVPTPEKTADSERPPPETPEATAAQEGKAGEPAADEDEAEADDEHETAKAAGPRRKRAGGRLSLRTTPASLKVYLGPRLLGVTPLRSVSVPAGTHALRLESTSRERRKLVVRVTPGGRANLEVRFRSLPRD